MLSHSNYCMTNCSCAYIHTNCFIESGANHNRLLNNKQQTLELEAWKWGFIISDNSYPPLRSFHEPCTMQTANGRRQFRNWVKKLNVGHFAAWICITVNSFTANHCVVQPVKLALHYWYSNNHQYSTIINTYKIIPIFSASCCNIKGFWFYFFKQFRAQPIIKWLSFCSSFDALPSIIFRIWCKQLLS